MNLIWDFGGTLFNTFPVTIKVFQEIFHSYNIVLEKEALVPLLKKSRETAFKYISEKYNLKLDFAIFMKQFHSFEKKYSMSQEPYSGAIQISKKVYRYNGNNFIFSHRKKHKILELLQKNEITYLFKDILTIEDGFKRKPSSEGISYIVKKYNLSLEETYSIGDREIDVLSSHRAKIKAILFDPERRNKNSKAEIIIHDYNDLNEKFLEVFYENCNPGSR